MGSLALAELLKAIGEAFCAIGGTVLDALIGTL